jgi:hypothetical protein
MLTVPVDNLLEIDDFLDPPCVRGDGEVRLQHSEDGVSFVPVEYPGVMGCLMALLDVLANLCIRRSLSLPIIRSWSRLI